MSFNLQISFTGLCLFVPRDDEKSLDVVLPHATMTEHKACIFYDKGHIPEGGGKPTYDFDSIDASGSIDLPSGEPSGSDPLPPITPELFTGVFVADVGAGAQKANPGVTDAAAFKVPKRALDPSNSAVAAIIRIPGGRLLSYSASMPWYYPDDQGPRLLAWKIEWLIENISTENDRLELTVHDSQGNAKISRLLAPIDGTVGLRVKHVPIAEAVAYDPLYSATKTGAHFKAFYTMLGAGNLQGSAPMFGHKPGGTQRAEGSLTTCTPGVAAPGGA